MNDETTKERDAGRERPSGYAEAHAKMLAEGGAPLDCGVCGMPVDYDAAVALANGDPGHRDCRGNEPARIACPSCGGGCLYAPDVFGGCETCGDTGEVDAR